MINVLAWASGLAESKDLLGCGVQLNLLCKILWIKQLVEIPFIVDNPLGSVTGSLLRLHPALQSLTTALWATEIVGHKRCTLIAAKLSLL